MPYFPCRVPAPVESVAFKVHGWVELASGERVRVEFPPAAGAASSLVNVHCPLGKVRQI